MKLAILILVLGMSYGVEAAPNEAAPREPKMGQNEAAVRHYKEGLRHRDAAWVYEEKMAGTLKDEERATYARFVTQTYQRALAELKQAVEADPKFYQAYSSLGYAYRKTGDLDAALVAYNKALQLNPNYTEAIEYRAEAYFKLDRIKDAQKAYDVLAVLNKPHAARLLLFARQWAEQAADKAVKDQVLKWAKEKRDALGEVKEAFEKW